MSIKNPAHWDYVVRRNKEIDSWHAGRVAARREIAAPIIAEQQVRLTAWEVERAESRDRLTQLSVQLLAADTLRRTQPQIVATFLWWMYADTYQDLSGNLGISRALFDKRLQRARLLLRREGATEDDLQQWTRGYTSSRPVILGMRTVCMSL